MMIRMTTMMRTREDDYYKYCTLIRDDDNDNDVHPPNYTTTNQPMTIMRRG